MQTINGRPFHQDDCREDCCNGNLERPTDEGRGGGSTGRQVGAYSEAFPAPSRPVSRWRGDDSPSDRLPRWPDPPPEPTYRTGRVGPLPPVPEESYPPGARDLPVEYADDLDVIAQANPSLGRRVEPNAFRRILNSTRKDRS